MSCKYLLLILTSFPFSRWEKNFYGQKLNFNELKFIFINILFFSQWSLPLQGLIFTNIWMAIFFPVLSAEYFLDWQPPLLCSNTYWCSQVLYSARWSFCLYNSTSNPYILSWVLLSYRASPQPLLFRSDKLFLALNSSIQNLVSSSSMKIPAQIVFQSLTWHIPIFIKVLFNIY